MIRPKLALALIAMLVAAISVFVGTAGLSISEVWSGLVSRFGSDGSAAGFEGLIWNIRLPRVVASLAVGAALGMVGAAMQGVYRNRMADPYLMGVSQAAGFGMVAGALVAPHGVAPSVTVAVASVAGLAAALGTRWLAARTDDGLGLILGGVALGFTFLAWTIVITFVANSPRLPTFAYFVFGSLGAVTWAKLAAALPMIVVASVFLLRNARSLDLLSLGESEARSLGVDAHRVGTIVLMAAGVAVGSTVAIGGVIGFVGILSPAIARRVIGAEHRHLLPSSALIGASVVGIADMAARTIAEKVETPVGIITAAVGGPLLLLILLRDRR